MLLFKHWRKYNFRYYNEGFQIIFNVTFVVVLIIFPGNYAW